jgi:O-antigen ligase
MATPNLLIHPQTRVWIGLPVLSFFALLLITPSSAFNVGPIILLLIALFLRVRGHPPPAPPIPLKTYVAFAGYFLFLALSTLITDDSLSTIDNPSRLILMLPILWLLLRYPPHLDSVWLGASLGALNGLIFALWQRFGLGLDRAEGFQHPIMFGDVGMLLGLLALVGATYSAHMHHPRRAWFYLLGGVAGMGVSILSGSRGGWIALPFALWTLHHYYGNFLAPRLWRMLPIALGLLAISIYLTPATGVAHRLDQALGDLHAYVHEHRADGSLGTRLELWRAALKMTPEAGLIGMSEDQALARLDQLITEGKIMPTLIDRSHFHNEALEHWVRHGLLGLAALLILYLLPLYAFLRHAHAPNPQVKAAAVTGIVTITATIDFGLTQKFFGHHIGMMSFAFTVTVLWGYILHTLSKPDQSAHV